MKNWRMLLVILSFVVPIVGCASADRDAPSASPAMSGRTPTPPPASRDVTDAHADCFSKGGTWHPDLSYCEYRSPGNPATLMR
jgi:hypothetical protein